MDDGWADLLLIFVIAFYHFPFLSLRLSLSALAFTFLLSIHTVALPFLLL